MNENHFDQQFFHLLMNENHFDQQFFHLLMNENHFEQQFLHLLMNETTHRTSILIQHRNNLLKTQQTCFQVLNNFQS